MNNEVKVAKYCQWDGYLNGQGKTLCNFISNQTKSTLKELRHNLSFHGFINDDALRKKWLEVGVPLEQDFVSMEQSKEFKEKYPYLHRDIGAEILELLVYKGSKNAICSVNDLDFGLDTLFCEYCYVVDLDNEVVEFRFNTKEEPFAIIPFDQIDENTIDDLNNYLEEIENE
jgi:hypothetical protein